MDKDKVLELIVKEANVLWEDYTLPYKFMHVSQRFNKVASSLGMDLRELVETDPRLAVFRTVNGGLVIFPKRVYKENVDVWESFEKSFKLMGG